MMQQAAPSRKRPAPGTSPTVQQHPIPPQTPYQHAPQPYILEENNDFGNFDFSKPFPSGPDVANGNNFSANDSNAARPPTYGSDLVGVPPSTDLVRRARNQQLAPAGTGQEQEQWNGGALDTAHRQTEDENEQELERKVAVAKKDAQAKRKQIPPFVQS